jgi:hypothetical protein
MNEGSKMKYTMLRIRKRTNGDLDLAVGASLAMLLAVVVLALTGHIELATPLSFASLWKWIWPH